VDERYRFVPLADGCQKAADWWQRVQNLRWGTTDQRCLCCRREALCE
jgi:hypothetical protein